MRATILLLLTAGARLQSGSANGSSSSSGSGSSSCQNYSQSTVVSYIENNITFFPPGESSTTLADLPDSMPVYLGFSNLRILSVDQASRSFTAAYDTDMYWPLDGCMSTNVLMSACSARLGSWYFVQPTDAIGVSTVISTYEVPASSTSGALIDFGSSCTNGDFQSVQTTFTHTYDMSYFPFEAHTLTIRLQSVLTTESITLVSAGAAPATSSSHTVPGSWSIERGWTCRADLFTSNEPARGSVDMSYSYIACSIVLSKVEIAWFLNSFILFFTIVLTNFFLSLGWATQPISPITGTPVDPRELSLLMGQRAATTTGLVLAYIFAIEYKPYGQSLGYFSGSIPLSFATYFTGLVALSVSGLWTAVMSYVALLQVRSRVAGGRRLSSKVSAPPEKDASDENIARAAAFGDRLAMVDFWFIAVVHSVALLLPLILLVVGAYSYLDHADA